MIKGGSQFWKKKFLQVGGVSCLISIIYVSLPPNRNGTMEGNIYSIWDVYLHRMLIPDMPVFTLS